MSFGLGLSSSILRTGISFPPCLLGQRADTLFAFLIGYPVVFTHWHHDVPIPAKRFGYEREDDARAMKAALGPRLAKFGLALHADDREDWKHMHGAVWNGFRRRAEGLEE